MTRAHNPPAAGPRGHVVQFYGADEELAAAVGGYLAEGIRLGDGVLVVATAPHRRAFEAALARAGIDAARERDAGRLLTEDAAELLDRFLAGDELDHQRFQSVASGLVLRAADGGRPVRIYAEMVAVLWDAGHVALAVELEALWNGLGALLPFALLCAYPSRLMTSAETAAAVREVGRLHSAVGAVDPGSAGDPGDACPAVQGRSFPPEVDSVRAARHVVAVLHARSGFTLTVSWLAAAVRIAVRDGDPLAPGHDGAPFDVRQGHGLSVVSQLASGWAVEGLPDGNVVWADLPAQA